jgi:DNA topoisomerase I
MPKKTKADKKKGNTILVIVESPAKASTINKYLGDKYKVTSSMGHIIDLPKSRMGIDVDHDFEPEYITVRGKGKILNELKKLAGNSSMVLLASDNDREGEAIAYLVKRALSDKYPDLPMKRIVFNEITKPAILESINQPRDLELDMIEAQKTRRVLDRLVGYNISPILWQKVKRGLSAGRVQSVAMRVICEREDEIGKFVPVEYWTMDAVFLKDKKEFQAELFKINNEKPELSSVKDVDAVREKLNKDNFVVSSILDTAKSIKATPPFITSKLQQAAANRFGFTTKKTMQVAQQLYEGINIGNDRVGLITYMRTDSTRISAQAINEAREYINANFPKALPESPNIYSKSSGAQDAHEAIRPTAVIKTPDLMKKYLDRDQHRLYSMIWERFVSSQMINSETITHTINIENNGVIFRASKTTVIEQGFNLCLDILKSKDADKSKKLPDLKEGDKVELKEFLPEQHFTQPPPRYTDASIVKFLEEKGIGRPSTYAPTITTLLNRYYVVRKARQLMPTVLGKVVNSIIVEQFPEIVDIDFTANMENNLDQIANGEMNGKDLLRDFYLPFKIKIDDVSKNLESMKKMFDEPTNDVCEKCGKPMIKKLGKYGFFLACSGFPACRNSKPIPLADCPREGCGGKIIPKRKGKRGREFYGCSNYPTCDFVTWDRPIGAKCPKCGKFLVEKTDKLHGTYKLCIDQACGYKCLEEHTCPV